MKCANCYLGEMLNNENYANIDKAKFESFLKRLPNRVDIRFIGAEPTMNQEIFDLIRITRKNRHRPSMLTNGLKLSKEKYTQSLKLAGLNMLGLSMNGGIDNDVYQMFDNGKYAKQKSLALENCFKYKILPHINLIMDPSNIHVISPLINYIEEMGIKHNIKFNPKKFPIALRVKSIGKIGFYKNTYTYSLKEMIEIMSDIHKVDIRKSSTDIVNGCHEKNSIVYKFETKNGTMIGKITDWSVDDDGIPDSGSVRRGILTNNFKISPFFEFYKKEQEKINEKIC